MHRLIVAIALSLACLVCAAAVAGYDLASVMSGILSVETGGKQFSINDNTTRRSYSFSTKDEAVKMAKYLISLDHNIDMGKFQINSIQLSRGWNVADLFESAFNRTAAETIFNEWLVLAKKRFGETELAWQRAIGAYNSGHPGLRNGNAVYETKVLRAMGKQPAPLDRDDPSARSSAESAVAAIGGDEDEEEGETDLQKRRSPNVEVEIFDILMMAGLVVALCVAVYFMGKLGASLLFSAVSKSVSKSNETARSVGS